jgi:hypothetical protein
MKAFGKTCVLVLASLVLASCGGGGGGSQSSFTPTPSDSISISALTTSIPTNSYTTLIVTVKKPDGSAEDDGTPVTASLSPPTFGTVAPAGSGSGAGPGSGAAGSSATATLSGGKASFYYNSTNQAGTATITFSLPAGLHGNPNSATASTTITVTAGGSQDPRLQLTATTTTLPLNPFAGQAQTYPFPGNYIGSPYIAEVTVTWRHSNGQLVSGTNKVNVSIDPVTIASFSTLDDPSTPWTGQDKNPPTTEGNEFLTLLGSGPVNVTGGNGVIFVHAGDIPGTATLTVTAIDPDNGQTISSQLAFKVAGAASSLPSSISVLADGGVYVSGSGGPQSTVVRAQVADGSNAAVADPNGFDNVEFQIVGPAGNDAKLSGINVAGQAVTGTKIDTVTHQGIASVTFQAGSVQGPVQVKATVDRGDNNVDNQIQDPVSATATVIVSDGKLFSLSIVSPDASAVTTTGVSANVTENPPHSGNYQLTISAKGVDRQGNPVLPGTQIGFGDIDSPQTPLAGAAPRAWFTMYGTKGDPQEGGTLFTASDGKFVAANGSGAGPGDTLLVIGKASQGAPSGNDDLESSVKITAVNDTYTLTVATPFNLNDTTGVIVDNHGVLPYLVGRAQSSSVQSPSFTDANSAGLTGVATTTLNYPASMIGKAVAIWAQGTGTNTNTNPGLTRLVTDIATLVFPGKASGAFLTASPHPLNGNTTQTVTVCYFDGNGQPIPNFDISFAFNLPGVGSGDVDGVLGSGKLKNLTGANGCATAQVTTASLPPTTSSSTTNQPSITFSAGPLNAGGAHVTVPFVVNVAQLQISCSAVSSGGVVTVGLQLLDASGNGVPGQSITGQCVPSGSGTLTVSTIPVTNANGATTATITASPVGTTG